MVNKKKMSPNNEDSDDKGSVIAEKHTAMDDLLCQNQTLEDDVLHIQ